MSRTSARRYSREAWRMCFGTAASSVEGDAGGGTPMDEGMPFFVML